MSAPSSTRPATTDPVDLAAVREARRGSRWRRWLGGFVLLGVVAGLVWAVWFSPLLAVREVRVLGIEALSRDVVVAAADVPVGTPLARVDVAAVVSRVQALPRVARVEVRRGFPHELVLVVVERAAVAVERDGTAFAVVDAAGVRFARSRTAAGRPILEAEDAAARRSGLDVLVALPAQVASRVATVRAASRDDVTLVLRSGDLVRWGDASRSERKAEVLTVLLGRRASVYDVSAPDLPTTS